jgi:hypothetical protein
MLAGLLGICCIAGGIEMSDGREEREEREKRRKQEEQENREDRVDRDSVDEGESERGGS